MAKAAIDPYDGAIFAGQFAYTSFPLVPGREGAGWITDLIESELEEEEEKIIPIFPELQRRRRTFRPGTRVYVDPIVFVNPETTLENAEGVSCDDLNICGLNIDGTLQERFLHPLTHCYPLPDSVSFEQAMFIAATREAIHAVDQVAIEEDEYVVVSGAGELGIITAQIIASLGANPILLDPVQHRLEAARRVGLPMVVNPFASYAAEEVEWMTQGRFADCVLETTGKAGAIEASVDLVGRGARIVLCRQSNERSTIDAQKIIAKNLSVYGLGLGRGDFHEALRLIEDGTVIVSPLISKTITLEEAVDELPRVAARPDHYMKVLVDIGEL